MKLHRKPIKSTIESVVRVPRNLKQYSKFESDNSENDGYGGRAFSE